MTVTKLNYFDAAMVRANAAVNIVVLTINCLSDVHCPITLSLHRESSVTGKGSEGVDPRAEGWVVSC